MQVRYNIYKYAKSKIKTHDELSINFFKCNVDVRQDENLSPVLFEIYLDDLQRFVFRWYDGLEYLGNIAQDALSDDDVELF